MPNVMWLCGCGYVNQTWRPDGACGRCGKVPPPAEKCGCYAEWYIGPFPCAKCGRTLPTLRNALHAVELSFSDASLNDFVMKLDGAEIGGIVRLGLKLEPGQLPMLTLDLLVDRLTVKGNGFETLVNRIGNLKEEVADVQTEEREIAPVRRDEDGNVFERLWDDDGGQSAESSNEDL